MDRPQDHFLVYLIGAVCASPIATLYLWLGLKVMPREWVLSAPGVFCVALAASATLVGLVWVAMVLWVMWHLWRRK